MSNATMVHNYCRTSLCNYTWFGLWVVSPLSLAQQAARAAASADAQARNSGSQDLIIQDHHYFRIYAFDEGLDSTFMGAEYLTLRL